jgi:hypothetical protein
MKHFEKLSGEEMKAINGGDEYTYKKGYQVGEFFGKIAGIMDRFVEIFK